jgi:hypothetical protein
MIKKILFATALLTNISAYCWDPYESPKTPEGEFYAYGQGYVQLPCPCCNEYRLFPSGQFVVDRRRSLNPEEERQMIQQVTDYTGDLVAGRLCPFCGRNLPTHEDFE